ncbi:uracil DNA glycosylase superfamily protein [Penicillium brasilianum]|uniref:Uracil DNA glycosylase superfamily protein n=1 Tax=Penicillium brasilianum TaxID=104259 RepID=A0A1S9RNB7_PENBI|nr:uracil DNA glycosylase superfamily protein [Penicillium brasilianum]
MPSANIPHDEPPQGCDGAPDPPVAEDISVDRITSFHGKLNRFLLTNSSAAGTTNRPVSPLKRDLDALEPKREATTNDLDRVPLHGRQTRSTTASPKRPKVERTVPTTARPTTITRSRSSSSIPQSPTASPQKSPRRRKPPPTHTPTAADSLLRDTIPANLILLLVGVNPGIRTGTTGFAYAHPSNLYWKLLHSSGITSIRHPPSDTYKLPALYNVGNTNIVERPSRDASMLSKAEMDAGVPVLEAKVAAQRPEAVCLVGKGIWEAVWRVRHGRAIRKEEFRYGWQDEVENMGCTDGSDWAGAPVFVATTTSGLAAGMSIPEKEAVWAELGAWVVKRRTETGFVASEI